MNCIQYKYNNAHETIRTCVQPLNNAPSTIELVLTYIPTTCKHVYLHWYFFRFDTLIKSANSNIRFKVLDSRHVSRHKVMVAITTTSFLDRKNLTQTYL